MDVQTELWGEGAGLSSLSGEQKQIVFELIWKKHTERNSNFSVTEKG